MPIAPKTSFARMFIGGLVATGFAASAFLYQGEEKPQDPKAAGTSQLSPRFDEAAKTVAAPANFMPGDADFQAYAAGLTINAQKPPYNLPANVFIITRTDMAKIGETVRQKLANVPAIDLLRPFFGDYPAMDSAIKEKGIEHVFSLERLEKTKADLVETYVMAHQAGFVKYTYRQAGYGTKPGSVLGTFKAFFDLRGLPEITEQQTASLKKHGLSRDEMELLNILAAISGSKAEGINLDNLNAEAIASYKQTLIEKMANFGSTFEMMNEGLLAHLTGETLLSLETRSHMMAPAMGGGILEMFSPDALEQRTHHDGSVLVGDDGSHSDGHYIQELFSFDPSKMNPDFTHLSYLADLKNFHEAGHHVMGKREELAEQYGAIKFMQTYPDKAGTLEIMRDIRNLHSLVSDMPQNLTEYARTGESLDRVLKLDRQIFASLDSAAMAALAREGHEPDEAAAGPTFQIPLQALSNGSFSEVGLAGSVNTEEIDRKFREMGKIEPMLALRVALFEEYQRQEQKAGIAQVSGTAAHYLQLNNLWLTFSQFAKQKDATFLGMMQSKNLQKTMLSLQVMSGYEEDLDPAILASAMERIAGKYAPSKPEHKALARALTALRNFKDPVRSYRLAPNFEPQPGWDEPVLNIGYNSLIRQADYDGNFAEIREDLARINSSFERADTPRREPLSTGPNTSEAIRSIGEGLFGPP